VSFVRVIARKARGAELATTSGVVFAGLALGDSDGNNAKGSKGQAIQSTKAAESQSGAKGGWPGEGKAIRAIEHGGNGPRIEPEPC
jgi:hypothetical protein